MEDLHKISLGLVILKDIQEHCPVGTYLLKVNNRNTFFSFEQVIDGWVYILGNSLNIHRVY